MLMRARLERITQVVLLQLSGMDAHGDGDLRANRFDLVVRR